MFSQMQYVFKMNNGLFGTCNKYHCCVLNDFYSIDDHSNTDRIDYTFYSTSHIKYFANTFFN